MSKMIQIRNVPDALHRKLKVKAAAQGTSLSEYLLEVARRSAEELTIEEWLERHRAVDPVHLPKGAIVEAIHQGRSRR